MTRPDPPPPNDRPERREGMPRLSRRTVLGAGATLAVTAAAAAYLGRGGLPETLRHGAVTATPDEARALSLDRRAWRTLDAALERLLPSEEGAPGARDVNAIGWLDAVLADPDLDPETAARVHDLARRLHAIADEAGVATFAALDPAAQDDAIRRFEEPWEDQLALRALLAYGLEALLGDPIHGVNPGAVGWTWADHTPGSPRPQPGWAPRGEGPAR